MPAHPSLCPDPVAPETRGVGSHSAYPLGLALPLSTMFTRCGGRGQKAPLSRAQDCTVRTRQTPFPYHLLTDGGPLPAVSIGTRPCKDPPGSLLPVSLGTDPGVDSPNRVLILCFTF